MQKENKDNARLSGQNAAGSAQSTERLTKALGASHVVDVGEMGNPWLEGPAKLRDGRQGRLHAGARVNVPCTFHMFLPKAGTTLESPSTRALLWDPETGEPIHGTTLTIPQWAKGQVFQFLQLERKIPLLLIGEVEEVHLEPAPEGCGWMPPGTEEIQVVVVEGFMTFHPADFFIGSINHALGSVFLEPNIEGDFLLMHMDAAVGNLQPWREAIVEFFRKAAKRGLRVADELHMLAKAGIS